METRVKVAGGLVLGLLLLLVLGVTAGPARAQTSTPTPPVPSIPLPAGWGPVPEIYIGAESGEAELAIDDELICGQSVYLKREATLDVDGNLLNVDPPAVIDITIAQSYGDGEPGYWPVRVRFPYWGNGIGINVLPLYLETYDHTGTVIDQQVAMWCPEYLIPADPTCDPVVMYDTGELFPWSANGGWRLFDGTLLMVDHGTLRIRSTAWFPVLPLTSPYVRGFHISSLYASYYSNDFPVDFCGDVPQPSPTPYPTYTPYPTWTATPTGTLTATPTLYPTAPGPTATPTGTPPPFVTWTPQPTATRWQTPAPTLWPSPTAADALPTVSFPTIVWPTLPPTVTPIYTVAVTGTATAPLATAVYTTVQTLTPLAPVPIDFMDLIGDPETDDIIGAGTAYSMTYNLISNLFLPLRLMRGLQVYLPSLYGMVAFVVAALIYIAVIRIIKTALGVTGTVLDVIHKIIDTILP